MEPHTISTEHNWKKKKKKKIKFRLGSGDWLYLLLLFGVKLARGGGHRLLVTLCNTLEYNRPNAPRNENEKKDHNCT